MATPIEFRRLRLWQNRVETEVAISGFGPALVYLHGPWGLAADRAFIEQLSRNNTVYAPKHPGTSRGNHLAVHALDSWLDLVVYYAELFDQLALRNPTVVGHSFGGLVAAEVAAASPRSVDKLVLIDPVGLWRDDLPLKNWMVLNDVERRPSLFSAPEGAAAQRFFGVPSDPAERQEVQAEFIWSQACTGKFVWPIAERGFKLRSHRISAPTLVIWGKDDRIAAPAYANEFAKQIAGTTIQLIDHAGHLPQQEQPEAVIRAIDQFLGHSVG
jgi:pimeloyl-ACP methyl ester carboxylesterase